MGKSISPKTDQEAVAIFRDMETRAGFLFRALDKDGDGVLSAEEVAAAPDVLRSLDADEDGYLGELDIGGPTFIAGAVRRSNIVKLLDEDGDLIIGPNDIAAASDRILKLDFDGDGRVASTDDMPPPDRGMENQLPMGTPLQALEFQVRLFDRVDQITGPLPPEGRRDVQPGFMLVQEMNDYRDVQVSKKMFLMDARGETVQEWRTRNETPEATVAYLLPDGNLLRTTCKHPYLDMIDEFPVGAHGAVTIEDRDSNVLWEWNHCEFGNECLHHDVEMMPDGNILVIAWDRLAAAEARSIGWVQQGDRDHIFLDKIYEVRPDRETGGTEIVWEWSVSDHVVQNADPKAPNFGDPIAHPEKIDLNWAKLDEIQFNRNQTIHMNTVSYNPDEDIILLSSAVYGEVWVIDHSTTRDEAKGSAGGRYGRGGDLLYRWGNPQSHGIGAAEDQVLYWQHDCTFLTNDVPRTGDMMLFNNGMRRGADGRPEPGQICMGVVSGAYSDLIELKFQRDADGLIRMGAEPEITWRFNSDGGHDFYSPFMSGAQRLPNGNTIMVQACDKRIVEITPKGEIVLDFRLGGPGRMFRIYKYPPNHPGIEALGLA